MHPVKPLLVLLGFAASLPAAHAATLCVNTGGSNGCYSHINTAVAAAGVNDVINVGPGTYHESVIITRPLSLNGNGATINAAGLSRGIYVDGIDAAKLAEVHISGFTVHRANFEGILVANASNVTIANNTVRNNNQSLSNGACPGLDSFEPAEQSDCGEGIHLLGADHAIVTGNTVIGNSGGILLSDDTATNHDNLISFNTVSDNAYACGIVLASHLPAALTGSSVALGVFHNTVYGNSSQRNGLSNGGGAGIGIFASIPTAAAYGNVVVNNFVSKNGLPGIAMHAHTPGQNLNDNMIIGNIVVANGPDTADAATPGTAGINIYSVTPATGNTVSGNAILGQDNAVVFKSGALLNVQFNDFLSRGTAVDNLGTGAIDATHNWWNCFSGANAGGSCATATGANLLTTPWLQLPALIQPLF